MSETVTLELSKDEALVLFECLAGRTDKVLKIRNDLPLDAGEIVLSGILCVLEKNLIEIFDPDYRGILMAAQRRVLGDAE